MIDMENEVRRTHCTEANAIPPIFCEVDVYYTDCEWCTGASWCDDMEMIAYDILWREDKNHDGWINYGDVEEGLPEGVLLNYMLCDQNGD